HTRWPRDWSSDVCSSDLAGEDRGDERRRGDNLLEIVKQQEHLLVVQVGFQRLGQGKPTRFLQSERPGNGRKDQTRLADGREGDEINAVLEVGERSGGDLQRQARLPAAARPGEGEQAG